MKKIKILKTSYLKNKIKSIILKICLIDLKFFNKKNKKEFSNKVLVVSIDSLGDNIVKCQTMEIFANEFGKENIYILCQNKWRIIYDLQGYKNIFVDETKWNIFYKIKLYRKLNKMQFSKVIVFDHPGYPPVIQYIYARPKYQVSEKVDYILEKHLILLKKVLNKEFELNDIRPNFKKNIHKEKPNNTICIGIGASGTERIMEITNMKSIVLGLLSKFPTKDIVLLGTGKREEKYAKELLKEIKNTKLKEYVGKMSLQETIEYINNCCLFIGGDSGLMNIAFSLNKKIICLHWSKNKYIWEHPFENIKIIKGKGGKEYIDKKYGTETLNSINFEQVDQAIEELKIS